VEYAFNASLTFLLLYLNLTCIRLSKLSQIKRSFAQVTVDGWNSSYYTEVKSKPTTHTSSYSFH